MGTGGAAQRSDTARGDGAMPGAGHGPCSNADEACGNWPVLRRGESGSFPKKELYSKRAKLHTAKGPSWDLGIKASSGVLPHVQTIGKAQRLAYIAAGNGEPLSPQHVCLPGRSPVVCSWSALWSEWLPLSWGLDSLRLTFALCLLTSPERERKTRSQEVLSFWKKERCFGAPQLPHPRGHTS